MKNNVLPIAVGIALIGCVLAVYANLNSSKLNTTLDNERSKRIAAEEQLSKAQQQIGSLQKDLGDAKSKMASIEKILNDGKELAVELEAIKMEREMLKQQVENFKAETAVIVE
jgi:peptidoglycan hydrolase CwlO-like protein